MTSTIERFSNRVENYAKYRPGYPPELLEFFKGHLGLTAESVVADIGSGTGLSSRPFLEYGTIVYGVEPNAGMRATGESLLAAFSNFRSIDGTASETKLDSGSIDLILAAQAFHWFDPAPTRTEFKRILKPNGYVALIWNERQLDSTPFLREYEQLLLKFATDYEKVRHENINEERIGAFFEKSFEQHTFRNDQIHNFEGLKGRLLSSSYMPDEGDEKFEEMIHELETLFAKHAEDGKITILYDTNVFSSQF
jgi:SAM-dependent methyltransferase